MDRRGAPPTRPPLSHTKRRREDAEDPRLLTLHLLLQAMIGRTVTIEQHDGDEIQGVILSADDQMNVELADAVRVGQGPTGGGGSSVRIRGADILFVHMPQETDATELLKARMRAIDHGKTFFRKRVKKKVVPQPAEPLAPIVSESVTEVHEDL